MTRDDHGRVVFATSQGVSGRILRSGKIDPNYGMGVQYPDLPGRVEALTSLKNGKTIGVGIGHLLYQPTAVFPFIVRLNKYGKNDKSFGRKGVVYPPTTRKDHFAGPSFHALGIDSRQRIIAGGRGGYNRSILISRYSANGKPDRSFGNQGEVLIRNRGNRDIPPTSVSDLKVVKGNKILAMGSRNGRTFVVKLKANGSIDRSFGRSGWAWGPPGGQRGCQPVECAVGQLQVGTDGAITVSSATYLGNSSVRGTSIIFRLKANGLRVKSFGDEGLLEFGNARVRRLIPGIEKRGLDPFGNPTGGIAAISDGRTFVLATASLTKQREKNVGLIVNRQGRVSLAPPGPYERVRSKGSPEGNLVVTPGPASGSVFLAGWVPGNNYRSDPAIFKLVGK